VRNLLPNPKRCLYPNDLCVMDSILRAGLSEPASIISVGNVTAQGGVVDFSSNGNIFTGDIDVSSSKVGTSGGTIALKAFNIFTGNLNASSTSAITALTDDYFGFGYGGDSADNAGTVSVEASSYLRTGNIDTSSVSDNGGAVTITANDAIVGNIDASGSTNPIRNNFFGYSGFYPFQGGDVSVKTTEPFKAGAITTDGVNKGTVSIGVLDTTTPTNGGTIELQDLPSLNKPKEAEEVRQNVLNLLSARVLAGKKMTAQEIADQLDITIEEAQIAVLSPIGEEIQIAAPDLSRLSQNGVEKAGAVIAVPIGFTIIIGGGILLYIYINNGDTIVTATDKTGKELWRRTGDAAKDLAHKYFPGIFPSSQDHGGGKNAQHGKSVVPPSLLKELEEAKAKLAKLKAEQGSKKDKIELAQKIDKLQKKIAQILKGQNHNQKAKGSNGQSKR
jgi:hypothetical protein